MAKSDLAARDLPDHELVDRLSESKQELFNLRFQHATGQLDNTHKLTIARREIARLLTVHIEREHAHVGGGEG